MLPESVLKKAASEMLDYNNTGQSVMEINHRSEIYQEINSRGEEKLRNLMRIPNDYKVLFSQGGATLQFAMVPLNLKNKSIAAYVDTGIWSGKAIEEAEKFLKVDVIASSKNDGYTYIPNIPEINSDYDYLHITLNNTAVGTAYRDNIPTSKEVPLVCDASSCIMSEEMDVSKFKLIYAGAQKNIGPAGVTVTIIHEDLIRKDVAENIPVMLSYDTYASHESIYNTPPSYSIYMMGLVLDWIDEIGGLKAIEAMNIKKAKLLYDFIDNSDFYASAIAKDSRSITNVVFSVAEKDKGKAEIANQKFVDEAKKIGMVNLGGHRLVGGIRVSIYNAMPIEGVVALVEFMKKFELENKVANSW
ncbi:phosphoserine aminotransferase [Alphaproteobacteria bacterium]|nr:phosphoserine aminotransferase [Alphaproteobacteria bacterium]